MSSCCSDYSSVAGGYFGARRAESDLKRYRHKGADPTTRLLRSFVIQAGGGQTILDIGGGIGALSFQLLEAGFARATIVDAAGEFLAAARQEAERRGESPRVTVQEGDFVSVGSAIPRADVVAMDRVVCCYPHYQELLDSALGHAVRLFAFSYPRDRWYVKAVVGLENALRALKRGAFRVFVHPAAAMGALAEERGFHCVRRGGTIAWAVEVYARRGPEKPRSSQSPAVR